jgi:hypothetical protein
MESASCYDPNILFYIEFNNTASLLTLKECIPQGVLKAFSATMFIAVDIHAGDHIVTLTSVKSLISDQELGIAMTDYGDVRSIYRGFLPTATKEIDNGKRYITFSGFGKKSIPVSVSVCGLTFHVKYSGKYVRRETFGTQDASHVASTVGIAGSPPHVADTTPGDHSLGNNDLSQPMFGSTNWFRDFTASETEKTKVNQYTQTEKQPKNTRNQQTEVKPKCQHFSSMVCGVRVHNMATNTEQPQLVDAAVQRNVHIKKKSTQTEYVETQDQKVQWRIPCATKTVQIMSLEDSVKEYRKMPRRIVTIPRKRKRVLSGNLQGPKDTKSIRMNSHSIHKYFQSQKSKLLQSSSSHITPSNSSFTESDHTFDFRPQASTETLVLTTCWYIDQLDRKIQSNTATVTDNMKTGVG